MSFTDNAIAAIKEADEKGRFYGVTMGAEDVRALLNGNAPDEAIDVLVNARKDALAHLGQPAYVLIKVVS